MEKKCCAIFSEKDSEEEARRKCIECVKKIDLYSLILENNEEDQWIEKKFKRNGNGKFVCLSMEALFEIVLLLSNRVNFLNGQLNTLFNDINFALHDIQAPVRAARSFSDLAKDSCKDENLKDYLDKIHISSQTITSMINDIREMVSLSKSENKEKRKIDFEYIIKEAINNLSIEIIERQAIVVIKKSEFPYKKTNNRLRWVRVFQNLISNAILYNKNKPKIEIWAENKNIFIKDNGIGIPEDKWDIVFDIFTRLSDREDMAKGTGSGLFLCKKLLMIDQCEIRIYESSDDGTTFVISCP